MYNNGQWDWSRLQIHPPEVVKNLVTSVKITINQEEDDPVWTISTSGNFSVASAWNSLRQRKDFAPFDSKLWHKAIPFKMSFLSWRAIHGRLSTDDRVTRFGYNLPSKCNCCPPQNMSPGVENCEHLFCHV